MSVHVANHKRNEEIPNLAESAVQLVDILSGAWLRNNRDQSLNQLAYSSDTWTERGNTKSDATSGTSRRSHICTASNRSDIPLFRTWLWIDHSGDP